MNILGIDIGGTKTAACIGNETGKIIASERMPTRPGDDLDRYMQRLSEMSHEVAGAAGVSFDSIDRVGISAPGPLRVDSGTLLAPPNNPGWRDVPIVAMCKDAFGLPVRMNNDANGAALAEFRFGSHKGTRSLLYLTCSTGMGAGIVINGALVQGETDMGGEVGHQCLDPAGPACDCGLRGCFESYCGGRAVAERIKRMIREDGIKTSIVEQAGGDIDRIDHAALARAAKEGDGFAVEQWDQFTERMAQGIGNLIMIINPQVIILGTIAIHEGEFLMKPLYDKLPRYTWEWNRDACEVAPSALGKQIGDLAAIAIAIDT